METHHTVASQKMSIVEIVLLLYKPKETRYNRGLSMPKEMYIQDTKGNQIMKGIRYTVDSIG